MEKVQHTTRIRLAYTDTLTDDRVGSAAEKNYYRVIPPGSTKKLFFRNREEYALWRLREYTEYNPEPWYPDPERPLCAPQDGTFDIFRTVYPIPLFHPHPPTENETN